MEQKNMVQAFEEATRQAQGACEELRTLLAQQIDETTHVRIENAKHEQELCELREQVQIAESLITSLHEELTTKDALQEQMFEELLNYKRVYEELIPHHQQVCQQLHQVRLDYNGIERASFWRLTKPLRVMMTSLKAILQKYDSRMLLSGKEKSWIQKYDHLHGLQPTQRLTEQAANFIEPIKITVVVHAHETSKIYLENIILSMKAQTYENWELCIVDSGKNHIAQKLAEKYMRKCAQIRYLTVPASTPKTACLNMAIQQLATGDFVGFVRRSDMLHPSALYQVARACVGGMADVVYTDEDEIDVYAEVLSRPHFKPDFAPDTLRSKNYISDFLVFKKSLFEAIGGFDAAMEGACYYDLILRASEQTQAKRIVHIPEPLYHARAGVLVSVNSDVNARVAAVQAHLARVGLQGTVRDVQGVNRITYDVKTAEKVSILIPNKDYCDDLKKCVQSVIEKTTYPNYEIIIAENNSKTPEIFAYYEELKRYPNVKVVYWKDGFNYSGINNFAASYATGEYYILLNNDIEVLTPQWIEELLMYAQRSDVGAVGAKLLFPDDTVQHVGVVLGIGGVAGHVHKDLRATDPGYFDRARIVQNMSAVTAACMMMRKSVFDEVGGLNVAFEVAFNDVDLCMRIRKAGYLICMTPYVSAYHYESKSRGMDDTSNKFMRFMSEVWRFQKCWRAELKKGDPYYNHYLTCENTSCEIDYTKWTHRL